MVAEGDSGQTALVFRVTLSKASSTPVSVNFATVGDSATASVDFISKPAGHCWPRTRPRRAPIP